MSFTFNSVLLRVFLYYLVDSYLLREYQLQLWKIHRQVYRHIFAVSEAPFLRKLYHLKNNLLCNVLTFIMYSLNQIKSTLWCRKAQGRSRLYCNWWTFAWGISYVILVTDLTNGKIMLLYLRCVMFITCVHTCAYFTSSS